MSNSKRPFVIADSDNSGDDDYNDESERFDKKAKRSTPEVEAVEIDDRLHEPTPVPSSLPTPSPAKPPAKATKPSIAQKNNDGETFFELGPKKRLTIRKWQDRTLIDIREYYQDKDNQTKPGKKGISLTPEQFQLIQNHSDEISEVINAMKSTGSAK